MGNSYKYINKCQDTLGSIEPRMIDKKIGEKIKRMKS